jgi:ribonuclease P protein component
MFKRENRLVPGIKFANSRFAATPQFIIKNRENGLEVNRFGIIVSKKVDKRAVARNKIKRFFRQTLSELNEKLACGHDILVIVKKDILVKSLDENKILIEKTFKKIGILNK